MSNQYWCAAALALAACTYDGVEMDVEARRRPSAPDAPAALPDASPTSGDAVTLSCYSEGAPDRTCASPDHCCFSNYTSQHNGYCTTDECAWGTIKCDGAEDCASGQSCCGTQSEFGGWALACQSSCGSTTEELCHPGDTCKNGGTCVSAYGVNNDFPRTLYICR